MDLAVLGIDPGPENSEYVLWNGSLILDMGSRSNSEMSGALRSLRHSSPQLICGIEQVRGFGIMASNSLFDTCHAAGRFHEAFGDERTRMVPRKDVAQHVCKNSGASHDKFIREALISRFGDPGLKKTPGVLYGVTGHRWAALAVAVTVWDREQHKSEWTSAPRRSVAP